MKPLFLGSSPAAVAGITRGRRIRTYAGLTLVEVMIAAGIFTMMALGTLAAMVQVRKMSESNFAQATAETVAQGIIEQVQLSGYLNIATLDTTDPAYSATLPLKFIGVGTGNVANIQTFNLSWAADAVTFTDIGEVDATPTVLGVLLDMNYESSGGATIRRKRYMPMRANLRRFPHTTDDNVEIILTYSWRPPGHGNAANSGYITREIRTIRSQAPSY